jgi:hypothetical protein
MMSLLLLILVFGIVAWIIGQAPIPPFFKALAYGVIAIILLVRAWPLLTGLVG